MGKKADPTLNEKLAALGYSTRPVMNEAGVREVVRSDGSVAFMGRAGDVWRWLRNTGQIR